VALELPPNVREALAALPFDEHVWRRVKPETLHVTLAFLGARPESDVAAIRPLIKAGPAPRLALGGVLLLPPRRARVLAVALDDPSGALAELQARVSAGLEALGVYTPERRAFRAHVTVGRLRPGVKPPRNAAVTLEPLRFEGAAVTLFRSVLHPSGARYEALATAALDGN
jgi:2'-5' RNA ligase